ncbi:N-acetylneuraminate synthase family protein [Pseudomonadales bacterium]|nr:N-acetylneuraminate synthase family protein [Pseudomonadales bacterium]
MSILLDLINRKQTDNVVVIGKGSSIDKIDLTNISDCLIINLNDSELIFPGDVCVFSDTWVLDFLKNNDPKCSLYFSDKEIGSGVSQVICDYVPSNPDSIQFMVSRFFSDNIFLEQHLIVSALRIADEIARIDGSEKNCFLLGFDFTASAGYTKKMVTHSHHSAEYSEHMISTQENALQTILAQANRLSIKVSHVGNKPYSAYSVEEFNTFFSKQIQSRCESVVLADKDFKKVQIVAEITTNHQGDMGKLLKMISLAKESGADYVKLQKRDVETFYSPKQLEEPYSSPFGSTFRDYRHGIELTYDQFKEVDAHCKNIDIRWFVSILDRPSFDFMREFDLDLIKLPSTISEHRDFLSHVANTFHNDIVISTGYTDESYEKFVLEEFSRCRKLYLLQCTSAYPCPMEDAEIAVVRHYSQLAVDSNIVPGYSSHDIGSICSMMAVAAGAQMIEKHVKLGSVNWAHFDDVALDLGTGQFADFVADIRKSEVISGVPKKRVRGSEHHKYWLKDAEKS